MRTHLATPPAVLPSGSRQMRQRTGSDTDLDRRRMLGMALGLGALSCRAARGTAAERAAARPRLGINLAAPDDFGSELPFNDMFRLSREWVSQREGAEWGKGPRLDLDAHGWVKHLDQGAAAEALMLTGIPGHVPAGVYTVLHDGQGKLDVRGDGIKVMANQAGRLSVDIPASCDTVFLRVEQTNPRNHVRNIRVLRPGADPSGRGSPWHPSFLERWRGVAALRFMDWQRTNDSKLRRWADRPVVEDATFTGKGVPVELMIDLANRLEADPWFCIPHLADDDFVRRFATLVRDRLSPRL